MKKFYDSILAGTPLSGLAAASVTVYNANTLTKPTLYSDNGITPLANPVTTGADGSFSFFVADGLYDLTIAKTGYTTETLEDIYHGNENFSLGICEGRLTLTAGTPVTTADVSAATSVYFEPYIGNRIALYDGTTWNIRTFAALTLPLAGLTASKPYDVFAYDNSGTVTLEALVWTNTTTRATALTMQDGVLSKTGAVTRRFLGSIYINATGGQTDDTQAKRYVNNYRNKVTKSLRAVDSTDSWTYTTAVWRQANNSAANQIDVMQGWAEDTLDLTLLSLAINSAGGARISCGIGEDSTSTAINAKLIGIQMAASTGTPAAQLMVGVCKFNTTPAVGRHFYTWLENSAVVGTTTWYGDNGGEGQSGLSGSWRC